MQKTVISNCPYPDFTISLFLLIVLGIPANPALCETSPRTISSPRICVAVLDQWKSKPEDAWRTDSTLSVQNITKYFKKQNPKFVFKDLTMLSSSPMDKDEYIALARKNRFDVLILGTTRSVPRPAVHSAAANPWGVAQDDPLLSGPRYAFAVTGEWRVINTSTSEVITTISKRFVSPGNGGGADAYDFETSKAWSSEQLLSQMTPELFEQTFSWWNKSNVLERYEIAFEGVDGQSADILEKILVKTEGIKTDSVYLISAFEGVVEFSIESQSKSRVSLIGSLKKQLGRQYRIDGIRSGKIIIQAQKELPVIVENRKVSPVSVAAVSEIKAINPGMTQVQIQPLETYGKYYALLIGIADYHHMTKLKTAIQDAVDISEILTKKYGYEARVLKNPGHDEIIDVLTKYRKKMTPHDNLLIYYAGHGWLDPETNVGYWFPADASLDSPAKWISNATVTDSIRALKAKHVIVIADSCYSGTLTRSIVPTINKKYDNPEYWQQLSQKKARVILTSGGNEPVSDAGTVNDRDHSVFASALLSQLEDNDKIIDGAGLYKRIRRNVAVNSTQTPEYSDLRMAGHDGGDFIFVRSDGDK